MRGFKVHGPPLKVAEKGLLSEGLALHAVVACFWACSCAYVLQDGRAAAAWQVAPTAECETRALSLPPAAPGVAAVEPKAV